jgi:clan AA aspartic protease
MITGVVTAARQAVVPLLLRDATGGERRLQAIIDTGINGALALPPSLVESLGLEWRGQDSATLADNVERLFSFYEAVVVWDSERRRIEAVAADGPVLVGMALLAGYELTIRVVPAGTVTISPMA